MMDRQQILDEEIRELATDLVEYLKMLGVPNWEHLYIGHGVSMQVLLKQFGIIICVMDRRNIGYINTKVNEFYEGYKILYVTPQDEDTLAKNLSLFFELVRSGYIRWLRTNYERMFRQLVIDQKIGYKIIKKRLEIYGDNPKYMFWKYEDEEALRVPLSYIYSMEPGYFDFIPEEV